MRNTDYNELISLLQSYDWNLDQPGGHSGWTFLIYASVHEDLRAMDILIKAGCNVDAKSKWGNTPLMWASRNGNIKAIKKLVAAGCDINLHGQGGDTALIRASINNQPEALRILIEIG